MITSSEEAVKAGLRLLVSDFVAAIRRVATDAWQGRLQTLSNMLADIQVTATFLQMEITEALSADAVDFARALREDTLKLIPESSEELSPSAQVEDPLHNRDDHAREVWDYVMEQTTWLPHQKAQADMMSIDLEVKPVFQPVVDAINQLGFLFRAPIPGDVKIPEPQGLSEIILNDPSFNSISPQQLRSHLQRSIVEPWLIVLKKESMRSLSGAIEKAGAIAKGKVETMLEKRIEELTHQGRPSKEIDMFLVNKLVLSRAKCAILYGAIDELYQRWVSHLSVILSAKFRPLVENAEEESYSF